MTPDERELLAKAIEAEAARYEENGEPGDLGSVWGWRTIAEHIRKVVRLVHEWPAEEPEPPWISVEDRLPEDQQTVAFVIAKEACGIDVGRVLGGRFIAGPYGGFGIPGIGGFSVNFWMPLPPPPAR